MSGHGNYWADYEGFDLDQRQGRRRLRIGAYADRIWIDTPMARFFRNFHRCWSSWTFSNDWRRSRHRFWCCATPLRCSSAPLAAKPAVNPTIDVKPADNPQPGKHCGR